ncbi:MAG: hypothetical protein QN135_09380 [Armatimonadota bacterium]|nr:hypothetical protein [Armatimonadota bacterium]
MNFRSTNAEGFVHFGGDIMSGANSTAGVLLSSNTVSPASDSADANLVLKGKGMGGVSIGSSTHVLKGFGAGTSTTAVIALAANAIVASTLTVPGLAATDVLYVGRSTSMSTALAMAGAFASGENEGTVYILNNAASTQSVAANATFPYAYFKV